MVTKVIHYLADAIGALRLAYDEEDDGTTADYILEAEKECFKALRTIVNGQIGQPSPHEEMHSEETDTQ